MSEIDPVILELRAELGKYRADLKSTTSMVQSQLGNQEKSVQRLEAQMRRSSDQISGAFRGIAGAFASAFSARQIQQLADGYTRFTNQLKVTGLEGQSLAATQENLFQIAQKYGTELESVGSLYSRAAQSSAELNASQGQLLSATEAVAASLKISGTSATEAQGALLQLGQALGSPRIQAEEFNSLLDTMQPLLREVAKRIEGTGGTIGGLTRKIKDLKGEGVSNIEFFRAINDSLGDLQKTAASSTLTLGNSFTVLNNALGKYIGEADQSLSATEQLSGAIIKISENLDTIIPALAAIIGLIGVRYVAALAAGLAGTVGLNVASLALAVSLNGVGAAATLAGTRLLAAFGGPIGAAVIALGAGIAYVASQSGIAAKATGEYAKQATALAEIQGRVAEVTERVATATGRARVESLAHAKALREETKQYLANAQAALIAAEAKATAVRNQARSELQSLPVNSGAGGGPDRLNGVLQRNSRAVIDANANVRQAQENVIKSQADVARLTKIIEGAAPPAVANVDKKPDKKKNGPSGPSAAEIEDRFQSELASLGQQTLSARQQLATSADERAELELRSVEAARTEALRSLAADKDYSTAQKARVKDALDNLAEFERERIARDLRIQKEEEIAELSDAAFRAQSDALRQQYDLAKSQAERRELAYEIIALEYEERDAALERIKNNKDLSDAVRERAAIEQAALREAQGRTQEQARRDTAGPLEKYFDSAKRDASELNELYEGIAVDGLQSLNDGLTDAIVNSKSLGDVFKNVAKQIIADLIRIAIQQQIVNALQSSFGGGGIFGGLFGGGGPTGTSGGMDLRAFGRASGGYVAPGQTVRVNEHRGGAEYLRMGSQGGTVIPLGQVNAQATRASQQSTGVVRVIVEEGPNFMSTIRTEATGVAVEVQRAVAPSMIDAAANETMRRANRPRMPGAGR